MRDWELEGRSEGIRTRTVRIMRGYELLLEVVVRYLQVLLWERLKWKTDEYGTNTREQLESIVDLWLGMLVVWHWLDSVKDQSITHELSASKSKEQAYQGYGTERVVFLRGELDETSYTAGWFCRHETSPGT